MGDFRLGGVMRALMAWNSCLTKRSVLCLLLCAASCVTMPRDVMNKAVPEQFPARGNHLEIEEEHAVADVKHGHFHEAFDATRLPPLGGEREAKVMEEANSGDFEEAIKTAFEGRAATSAAKLHSEKHAGTGALSPILEDSEMGVHGTFVRKMLKALKMHSILLGKPEESVGSSTQQQLQASSQQSVVGAGLSVEASSVSTTQESGAAPMVTATSQLLLAATLAGMAVLNTV